MPAEQVTLGGREYPVPAQRIGYLQAKLGGQLGELGNVVVTGDNPLAALGGQAHAVLAIFIPTLMPEHEFQGYATREAYEAGDYDPDRDSSPTAEEVSKAFEVVFRVNGDLGRRLGKVIRPEFLGRMIELQLAETASGGSVSSQLPSGESESTSSGTKAPTSKSNGASPTPDSSPSSTPAPSDVSVS